MEDLKCLVKKLEQTSNEKEQIRLLQAIGDKLLTEYVIVIPTLNVTIEPLRVEAYYYPYNDTSKFDDPCAHPSSTKVNNFGHLYFIEEKYGYPGVDLCLSLGDYYLSFLIKNSRVDGKLFKQMDLYEAYQGDWREIQKVDVLHRIDNNHKMVLYTSRVGLKESRTKFFHEKLAAVTEIDNQYDWEKGFGKLRTIASYLVENGIEDTANLTAALGTHNIPYRFLPNTKDIWVRDFMPVRTGSGKLVSFRYEPSYLKDDPDLRTDFRKDLAPQLGLPVTYSNINLDGGNVVFSPSGARVLISDRVFSENPEYPSAALVHELSELLETEVLIIPSLKSDMTGHADGMARFLDDRTVLCNRPLSSCGFEQQVKRAVQDCGLDAVDFPFVPTGGVSAVGCYLNYLETERVVFLPVFGIEQDAEAETSARQLFSKEIVSVNIREIAQQGGCLNCISWEGPYA